MVRSPRPITCTYRDIAVSNRYLRVGSGDGDRSPSCIVVGVLAGNPTVANLRYSTYLTPRKRWVREDALVRHGLRKTAALFIPPGRGIGRTISGWRHRATLRSRGRVSEHRNANRGENCENGKAGKGWAMPGHRHCDCKARRDKAGALTVLAARRTIVIEKSGWIYPGRQMHPRVRVFTPRYDL